MKLAKWLALLLLVVGLALVARLVATRALAPIPGPDIQSTEENLSSNLLSGTVTGLDPGDRVRLQLELLGEGGVVGRGEIVKRFDVINGPWGQRDLALASGHYRLVPQAERYFHVPHSIVFQILDERIVWRYTDLNFEFSHPADAVARLGLPLCPEPSFPVVPVTAVSEGTPSPELETKPTASGRCYANHLADVRLVPAGLRGRISDLPDGQVGTISLYALPPLPGEQYGQGEPPPPGSSHPPEVSRLTAPADIVPDWPLLATLRVGNGPWGLVDPSLVGRKYLVVASTPGQTMQPPGYEVVIFGGKALGFPDGVDFAFGP